MTTLSDDSAPSWPTCGRIDPFPGKSRLLGWQGLTCEPGKARSCLVEVLYSVTQSGQHLALPALERATSLALRLIDEVLADCGCRHERGLKGRGAGRCSADCGCKAFVPCALEALVDAASLPQLVQELRAAVERASSAGRLRLTDEQWAAVGLVVCRHHHHHHHHHQQQPGASDGGGGGGDDAARASRGKTAAPLGQLAVAEWEEVVDVHADAALAALCTALLRHCTSGMLDVEVRASLQFLKLAGAAVRRLLEVAADHRCGSACKHARIRAFVASGLPLRALAASEPADFGCALEALLPQRDPGHFCSGPMQVLGLSYDAAMTRAEFAGGLPKLLWVDAGAGAQLPWERLDVVTTGPWLPLGARDEVRCTYAAAADLAVVRMPVSAVSQLILDATVTALLSPRANIFGGTRSSGSGRGGGGGSRGGGGGGSMMGGGGGGGGGGGVVGCDKPEYAAMQAAVLLELASRPWAFCGEIPGALPRPRVVETLCWLALQSMSMPRERQFLGDALQLLAAVAHPCTRTAPVMQRMAVAGLLQVQRFLDGGGPEPGWLMRAELWPPRSIAYVACCNALIVLLIIDDAGVSLGGLAAASTGNAAAWRRALAFVRRVAAVTAGDAFFAQAAGLVREVLRRLGEV